MSAAHKNNFLSIVVIATALAGIGLTYDGRRTSGAPPQPAAAAAPPSLLAAVPEASMSALRPMPAALPVRIDIPSIRVDAPLTTVHRDKDGSIATPPDGNRDLAGWFDGSVSPGASGTAVLVGHVDTRQGPAVFYDLGALPKGKKIIVTRADGTRATFIVYGIAVYDKDRFPATTVYRSTAAPELRVITCGGSYSKARGYSGNVVVYARLAATG